MESTTIIERPGLARPGHSPAAANAMGVAEVRYLVDAYLQIRENRKDAGTWIRSMAVSGEPHSLVLWLHDRHETLENEIDRALDSWTDSIPAATWAKGIVGIGPVIAAGLAAHIDIARCPTVGRIWRFAGLDPTQAWPLKTKRPWNADLKRLAWLIGEAFAEAAGSAGDFYGKLYAQRQQFEQQRNDAGELADQAAAKLQSGAVRKNTEAYRCYSQGKLPPAHIRARAKRWTVKLFLAHYHHVAWKLATGMEPPKPYAIAHLGHADFIAPPNFPGAAA